MLKKMGFSVMVLVAVCGLTFAQTPKWKLVEIERTAPYNTVLNSVPGLTSDQYATATTQLLRVLNGEMSPDQLLAASADEPLIVRASIAIVDALLADKTKQLKLKQSLPARVAA